MKKLIPNNIVSLIRIFIRKIKIIKSASFIRKPLAPAHGTLNNRRGIALIMAVSSLVILTYLAMEVSYDSTVEYTVNSQGLNRIKAYYAAKSAARIGLLRIKLYQQLMASPIASQMGSMADQIWQFPLAWPLPIPKEMNAVDRDSLKKAASESIMDSSWDLSISDEGSKIDLNDLVSPSKKLREITREQLLAIFKSANEQDENWRKKNSDLKPEEIVNALTDWQSGKLESVGGGDKRSRFANLGPGYPPNRAFRTLDEIRLVPGVTEEIFELISPRVTIYGMKAINPNSASEKVLLSLDPSITEKAVTEILKYRSNEGTFSGATDDKCAESFWSIAGKYGARPSDSARKIPMTCNGLSTFKITATGVFGEGKNAVRRDIEVITMNLSKSANRVKKLVADEKAAADKEQSKDKTPPPSGAIPGPGASGPGTSGSSNNSNEPLPKGPPRIVYWNEK